MKSKEEHHDYILQQPNLEPEFTLLRIPCDLDCREESLQVLETFQPPITPPTPYNGPFIWSAQCDGMLCTADSDHSLLVWNPATKVHRRYPPIPKPDYISHLGFGYDSAIDDYKVVNILSRDVHISESHKLAIHSLRLKTDLWNVALNEVQCDFYLQAKPGKTVDGFIYWMAKKQNMDLATAIVSFDIEKERLREVIFPDNKLLDRTDCFLGTLKESLCLMRFDSITSYYDVWVMNSAGGKCWENLFKFSAFSEHLDGRFFSIFHYQVLTNEYNEEAIKEKIGQIFLHDLKDRDVPTRKIRVTIDNRYAFFSILPYVESLVSPGF